MLRPQRIAPVGHAAAAKRAALALLLGSALAACDFPTEVPKWDQTWVIPGAHTRILVDSLLPAGLRVGGSGNTFTLGLPPATFSRTVGEMCGAPCAAANGLTVPKPPFSVSFGGTIALPRDVRAVAFTGAEIQVRLQNGLGFDPIRPSATARGHIILTARAGTRTLARDSVAGEAIPFPDGSALTRTLVIGADSVSGPIDVEVRISSPAGDPVRIDVTRTISGTATPASQVTVTRATVAVTGRTLIAERVVFSLADIDDEIIDRTQSGALLISSVNPFEVTGRARITLTSPAMVIQKEVEIKPGSSVVRVDLTGSEMRAMLGETPVMDILGTVSAPSGSVVVTPGQVVDIDTRLELILGPDAT